MEFVVASLSETPRPALADVAAEPASGPEQTPAARGVADDPRPSVDRVAFQPQVTEALEVADQIIGGLLAELEVGGQVGRAHAVNRRTPQQRAVDLAEVVESAARSSSWSSACSASHAMRSSAPTCGSLSVGFI
jgi:hypothetical protein